MSERTCLAVVLGAGEGTRMRSSLPKMLHPVGGLPLIGHVVRAVAAAGADTIAVVVGPGDDAVAQAARAEAPDASVFVQEERLGTAHAVLAARDALAAGHDDVVIVFGDTPFVSPEAIAALRALIADGAAVAVGGMRPADPAGYGRLIMDGDRLVAIREDKDASGQEREIGFCNGGLMAMSGAQALAILEAIGTDNAQGEHYLPDAARIANERGLTVCAMEIEEAQVFGINSRGQLAQAEARFQAGRRAAAMDGGATLVAPDTVFFCHDTRIGRDVTIEPNVVIGPGVTIEDGATIRAFSYLEGARVAGGAVIGPFARLRPGANIGRDAKVGNFCEVKNAEVRDGAKISHLSYVGDADIGARANIGAGTITCNYDGLAKYRTIIGENAFIGSNTALVAPVTIGQGAYVGSGSVITQDVPDDALAVGRGRQVTKPGWAARTRAKFASKKT
jgi:bifunctional UDP-N-acetylglucosamine pyrophosphorylase/glucosamine-1-phosphate N-acetyltransferase